MVSLSEGRVNDSIAAAKIAHDTAAQAYFGVCLHVSYLLSQSLGLGYIAAIHACNVAATGPSYSLIHVRRHAPICLIINQLNARVGVAAHYVRCVIRRAIIVNQKFESGQRLIQNAIYLVSRT